MTDYKQLPLQFPPEIIEIPLSKTGKHAGLYVAIIDAIDSDLAEFNWAVARGSFTKYAHRAVGSRNNRQFLNLHRVIMERVVERKLKTEEQIDHINGNGLDNRRENLRIATRSENQRNRHAINGSIPFKGVSRHKSRYKAVITINRKSIFLGLFDTPELAHEAYCEAAIKHHGEFANFGGGKK